LECCRSLVFFLLPERITSLDDPDEKAKGMSAGADEYLTKPVNRTELLTRIKSMIRLKQYQEQLTLRNVSELPLDEKGKIDKTANDVQPSHSVLLVDDNSRDVFLIQELLKNEPYHPHTHNVYVLTHNESSKRCIISVK
jgi:two-component system cell cycle response regulator